MCGMREVSKSLKLDLLKHIIIAPHIESISGEGGLDQLFDTIATACAKKGIEMTYALNRNKLGKAVGKKMKVSMIGIIDYGGANESFSLIKNLTAGLREQWFMRQADRLYDMEYFCEYDKVSEKEKEGKKKMKKTSAQGWPEAKTKKKKNVFNISAKAFVPVGFYSGHMQQHVQQGDSANPYSTAYQDHQYGVAGGGEPWSGSGYSNTSYQNAEPLHEHVSGVHVHTPRGEGWYSSAGTYINSAYTFESDNSDVNANPTNHVRTDHTPVTASNIYTSTDPQRKPSIQHNPPKH